MNPHELQELALKAKAGDNKSADRIYLENLPTFKGILNRFCRTFYIDPRAGNTSDIEQSGIIFLWKGWRTWDPTIGTPIGYAASRYWYGLRHGFRKETRYNDTKMIEFQDDGTLSWTDQYEVEDYTEAVLTYLTPRQREAFTLVHMSGVGMVEAAKSMGVSHQRVFRLIKSARKRLIQALIDRGINWNGETMTPPARPEFKTSEVKRAYMKVWHSKHPEKRRQYRQNWKERKRNGLV